MPTLSSCNDPPLCHW